MFTGQEQLIYSLGEKEELVPADKLLWLWVRKEQRKWIMVRREIVKARKEIPRGGMKNLQYEKEGKDRFTGGKKRRNLFKIEEKKRVWKRL
jgi:hypothetical protein